MRKTRVLWLLALAAVIFVIVGAVVTVHHGFRARDQPSSLETYVARLARRLAVPSGAKNENNQFTASPELMAEARAHFADHCAICHANNGSGNTEIGQNLYPKAPDMRLPQTQNLTDGELYYTIHNGIRLTGMPLRGARRRKTRTVGSWCFSLGICPSSRQRRNARWKRSTRRVQERNRRS